MNVRRFNVWLISLTVILAVYWVYSRINRTPQIGVERTAPVRDVAGDVNAGDANGQVGMIGDVGVGGVRGATYIKYNERKEVERVFGFANLVHKVGDEWGLEKPFMEIHRPNFRCYLTADKGEVLVETAGDRTTAKDGTLSGNVVIRIVTEGAGDVNEAVIYLDEVTFSSERSQFSTEGFVEFVSRRARLEGRGMELIYNEERQRLELLKIADLQSLRIKPGRRMSLFLSPQAEYGGSGDGNTVSKTAAESRQGDGYRCVLKKNVTVDAGRQLVFADAVSITDIFKSKQIDNKQAQRESRESVAEPNVGVLPEDEPNEIVVKCDGGVVVAPMDSNRITDDTVAGESEPPMARVANAAKLAAADVNDKAVLIARRIDYSAASGDAIAAGPAEIRFNAIDANGEERVTMPVEVTAQSRVSFMPKANQVVLEGKCRCSMVRAIPDGNQQYILSAEKITMDLPQQKNAKAMVSIRNVTAAGDVHLASTKTAGEKIAGGIELKCVQFDYDAVQGEYIATGPGSITFDNSKVVSAVESKAESNKAKVERLSLRRPCYGFLRNFQELRFSSATNRIVAEAARRAMLIDYIPAAGEKSDDKVAAAAGRVEAAFYEGAGGRAELTELTADNGVTYEDSDVQFAGSRFIYDAKTSLIKAQGSDSEPCLLNGALVDGLEYNIKTGKVKAQVKGPGAIR
jgi:hypothetical protein